MKKLMFATALVASAAAFADSPLNAISFEGYSADATVGNAADTPDASGGDNGMYFYFDGDGDGSLVKAFGSGDVVAPQIRRPLFFASASPNANYLELSTEGGILWRSINTVNSDTSGETPTYDLGNAKPIAANGTYFDSLVQFTPTEDGGDPELENGVDKLAIWLNVDSNQQTNLQVRANLYDFGEAPSATEATFTLAPSVGEKKILPGEWYRLTIKAIPNVMVSDDAGVIPAFEIYIDGEPMCATTAQFTSGMVTTLTGMNALSEDMTAAIAANRIFPSLAEMGAQGATPTLQGVGFKGSGAIDDIVWTEEDPFAGGAGGDDYKVEIGGSDVIITPQAGDLAALQAAIVAGGGTLDVTDVAAVNAALAAPIPGTSPSIPSWQALFLGVAPTTNGLEQVAIESITIENGTVTVAMSDDLTLMTGRGVDIVLKVIGSNDLSTWNTETPIVTATNTLTIPAITPALGETKKFYKVVVEFAATPAQQN
jgi:hypothetical protein